MSNFIQLIDQPESIDFCRNPICFVFLAANVFPTTGTLAVGKLEKVGTTTEGQTIIIRFLDYEFTFTFKNSVDDSGFQLSAAHTINDTVEELQYNYYLTKYYNITVDTAGKMMFCAKEKGADYTLTFDVTGCPAYTVYTAGCVLGIDPVKNPNFKVFVQLLASAKNADDYHEIITAFLDPDEDDKAYFYPGPILKDLFARSYYPIFEQTDISTWLFALRDYKVQYAEYFGDDPSIHRLHEHKALTLIDGKLHNDKWPTHSFINDLAISKIFLTNKSTSHETWLDAHEYLFFMNYVESDYDFTLHFDITYDDGTTTTMAKSISYSDSKFENIYCIPVGAAINGLDALQPAKTISFYKVYIEHSSTLISQVRTFYIINKPHSSLQLLFKNNYGCIDSLLCVNTKIQLKHDAVFLEKLLSFDYNISKGSDASFIKDQSLSFSTNTGYITAGEAYQLAELYENNSALLVGKTEYIKIELLSNSLTLIDRKDDLENFEIKFKISVNGTTSFNELI
ncbi:MAG: hypothetical protein RQ761_10400 [Bacteroidales bacterium]|nr:hypothetical protein [Bacteroidales bacterium]